MTWSKQVFHLFVFIDILIVVGVVSPNCGTFKHTDAGGIALTCNRCPAGTHVAVYCTKDTQTICTNCPSDTFSSYCNQAYKCGDCKRRCEKQYNESILRECSSTHDLECGCHNGSFRKDERSACKIHKSCPAGSGVKNQGTRTDDTMCEECPVGRFSSSTDKNPCKTWTNCTESQQIVYILGNRTNDTICRQPLEDINAEVNDGGEPIGPNVAQIVGVIAAVVIISLALTVGMVFFCKWRRKEGNTLLKEREGSQIGVEEGNEGAGRIDEARTRNNWNRYGNGHVNRSVEGGGGDSPLIHRNHETTQGNPDDSSNAQSFTLQAPYFNRTGNDWKDCVCYLSDNIIGKEFRDFFRRLRLNEAQIAQIEHDHQRISTHEVIVQGCEKFRQTFPEHATVEYLIQAADRVVKDPQSRHYLKDLAKHFNMNLNTAQS